MSGSYFEQKPEQNQIGSCNPGYEFMNCNWGFSDISSTCRINHGAQFSTSNPIVNGAVSPIECHLVVYNNDDSNYESQCQ